MEEINNQLTEKRFDKISGRYLNQDQNEVSETYIVEINNNTGEIGAFVGPLQLNKDFVYVLAQHDGRLEKQQLLIPQTYLQLLFTLDTMRKCHMFSMLEVQECFRSTFPESVFSEKKFSYVYPDRYNSANKNLDRNGNTIKYPELLDEKEYNEKLDSYKIDYIKKVNENLKEHVTDYEEQNPNAPKHEIYSFIQQYLSSNVSSKVKNATENYEKTLKEGLICKCEKFIYAHQYNQLTDGLLLLNHTIKMYSTEQCGWKSKRFAIIDNVDIIVESNFAFGRSSYFRCIISYKGIEILSYSAYVHYYYANMLDLCRCTREYESDRNEWSNVLDFVAQTVNSIRQDPVGFEQTFILDEIEELMKQLRAINDTPDILFEKLKNKNNHKPQGYSFVNDYKGAHTGFVSKKWHNDDVDLFAIYPNEKVIIDKISKISGALRFLDNLKKLSNILPEIEDTIRELSDMNSDMIPLIDKTINFIEKDINKIKEELTECESKISSVNESATIYFKELADLFQKCNVQNDENKMRISNFEDLDIKLWFRDDLCRIEQDYRKNNRKYEELKENHCKLNKEKDELNKLLYLRNNLLISLNESKQTIEKYLPQHDIDDCHSEMKCSEN